MLELSTNVSGAHDELDLLPETWMVMPLRGGSLFSASTVPMGAQDSYFGEAEVTDST